MKKDADVVIVGGGLNGPALALALAQAGLRTAIVDAAPRKTYQNPAFDGRAYALSFATIQLLKALQLWPSISAQAQPILDIKVSTGEAGRGSAPFVVHFDHRELDTGPMGHLVEDRYLRSALLSAIEASADIELLSGETVTDQRGHPGGIEVSLASGRSLFGSLLIGADGRASGTARRAGIARTEWAYDQASLVCAIAHERPHDGIAHQMFFPEGPLAILPLPGNRSSIVWTESADRAAAITAMDDQDYLTELRPRFGSFLGEIELAGDRYTYPLGLSLAQSLTGRRTALVGDAAHGIHPLAGQGLNLGLRDVAALADVAADAIRRGADIGAADVLDRYARWRRFDIAALAVATDGINRIFSNRNPILAAARTLGLGMVEGMPSIRRGMMREAAGLTGDLPRLLRGLPL